MSTHIEAPVRDEIRALTGLRAIAAAWVVILHFSNNPSNTWTPFLDPIRPLIRSGWLGVDLFFVLSGFVLTYTYLAKIGRRPGFRSAAAFYWNRLSRVWPTWVVVTLAFTAWLVVKHLTVGGTHVHDVVQPEVTVPNLLEQFLMIQQWGEPRLSGTSIVGPGWSLSAEWLAYVAFPVVVLVLFRLRRLPAVLLGAGAVAAVLPFAYIAGTQGMHDYAWSWLLRIAGCFLAGALTALCIRAIEPTERTRRLASYVAAGAIVSIAVVVWWSAARFGNYAGVAVLAFPVLVGALALADGRPARFLSTPAMVLGGRISFALYLVHLLVFEIWWTALDVVPRLQPESGLASLLAPLVLVAPLPLAYVTWRFVEEPARVGMRRLAPKLGLISRAAPAEGRRQGAEQPVPHFVRPGQQDASSDPTPEPSLVNS